MTWNPIPDFPCYEASDAGLIRSKRCVLKPWLSSQYLTVGLRRHGGTHNVHVHRLVLLAFVGRPDVPMDGCHNNGDRLDNRLSNLRWDTRSENILDQVRHGRHNNARKTHCKRGHEFTPENTYALDRNRRQCVTCTRAAAAARYSKQVAA